MRPLIKFLYSKGSSAAENHRELCLVYRTTLMGEGQKGDRDFRNGLTNVDNEKQND